MDKQRILNIIKNRRKDLKFTQKDVADKLDIERSQYSRYEIGKSEMTLDKFIEISKLLGLELADYEEKQEIDSNTIGRYAKEELRGQSWLTE